ncbi:MAG: hypothetical protein WC054_02770 [Candidatus Nanopelagicales bacterium]
MRYRYCATPADAIISVTGAPIAGAPVTVRYPSESDPQLAGTVQVTDLQNSLGDSTPNPTSDEQGFLSFFGPDGYRGVLWVETGIGSPLAVFPLLAQSGFDVVTETSIGDLDGVDLTGVAAGTVLTFDGTAWKPAVTQSARVVRWLRDGEDGVGAWEARPDIDEPFVFLSVGDPLAPPPGEATSGEYEGHEGSLWVDVWERDAEAEDPEIIE